MEFISLLAESAAEHVMRVVPLGFSEVLVIVKVITGTSSVTRTVVVAVPAALWASVAVHVIMCP